MYARVAKWEGAEGEALRRAVEQIKGTAEQGPPEGVPAKGFLMLVDPDNGRSLAIALFETEEDLRQGHATLNSMSPQIEGTGSRTSVETYQVGVEIRL